MLWQVWSMLNEAIQHKPHSPRAYHARFCRTDYECLWNHTLHTPSPQAAPLERQERLTDVEQA